jgi:hypothetical protein
MAVAHTPSEPVHSDALNAVLTSVPFSMAFSELSWAPAGSVIVIALLPVAPSGKPFEDS